LFFSVSKPSEEELEGVISPGYEEIEPGLVDPCDEYGIFIADKALFLLEFCKDGSSSS